jgi:WhiB family redox-sensing transcriptional regulator
MADDWTEQAACRGMDPDLFFPERGHSTAEAKAVCGSCPVRDTCLDEALARSERFGIWGGKSERERRRLRTQRDRHRGRPAVPPERLAHIAAIVDMHIRAGDPAPISRAAAELGVTRKTIGRYLAHHRMDVAS